MPVIEWESFRLSTWASLPLRYMTCFKFPWPSKKVTPNSNNLSNRFWADMYEKQSQKEKLSFEICSTPSKTFSSSIYRVRLNVKVSASLFWIKEGQGLLFANCKVERLFTTTEGVGGFNPISPLIIPFKKIKNNLIRFRVWYAQNLVVVV